MEDNLFSEEEKNTDVEIDSFESTVDEDKTEETPAEENPFPDGEDIDVELEDDISEKEPPLVSVVMPVYNQGHHLAAAIASVLVQDFTDFELIIINDCSNDQSETKIKEFSDERITYVSDGIKRGSAGAKNRALGEAQGRYVAFINGDDIWLQGKLREQLRYMQAENCVLSFTDYVHINNQGVEISKPIAASIRVDYPSLLRYGNCIDLSTAMCDMSRIHGFRIPSVSFGEDFAFWLEILRETNTSAVRVPSVYVHYRVHEASLTKNGRKSTRGYWHIWRVLEKQSFFASLGHLLRCSFSK